MGCFPSLTFIFAMNHFDWPIRNKNLNLHDICKRYLPLGTLQCLHGGPAMLLRKGQLWAKHMVWKCGEIRNIWRNTLGTSGFPWKIDGNLMGTHWDQGMNQKNPNLIRSGCIASTTSWAKILAQFFCQANQHTLECFSFQTYFTRHLLGCSGTHFTQGKGKRWTQIE